MAPCKDCIELHVDLVDRRTEELVKVVIEVIRDGYEDVLPEQTQADLMKEVKSEMRRRQRIKARATAAVTKSGKGMQTANSSRGANFFRRISSIKKIAKSLSKASGTKNVTSTDSNDEKPSFLKGEESSRSSLRSSPEIVPNSLDESGDVIAMEADGKNSTEGKGVLRVNKSFKAKKIDITKAHSLSAISGMKQELAEPSDQADSKIEDLTLQKVIPMRPPDDVGFCCIVDKSWIDKWKRFVQAGGFEDAEFPISPPGPISNHRLLRNNSPQRRERARYIRSHGVEAMKTFSYSSRVDANLHVLPDLQNDTDYVVISPGVWNVLLSIYGGGPPLFRTDIGLYFDEYIAPEDHC